MESPFDKLGQINKDNESKIVAEGKHSEMINAQKIVSDTIIDATTSLIKYLEGHTTRAEVVNQLEEYATTQDIATIASKLDKLDKSVLDGKTDITPLLVGLNAVKEQIKSIPETKFEQKDNIKVTNLSEIRLDTSAVEKAIKAQKLEVNVEAPIIKTEKTDTKLVESILSDIFKAVSKKQEVLKEIKVSNLGEIQPTDTSTLEKEQKKQTKLLKDIADKPVRRGGGGGGIVSYVDSTGVASPVTKNADGSVPVTSNLITGFATEATLALIKNTDGIKKITDAVTIANPTTNPETGLAKTADITKTLGLSGTLSDTSVTMTSATTAYQLPVSAPASAYTLVIYNTSTTGTIFVRFTTGTTLGIPVAPGGTLSIDLGANVAIFAYSATAGVVVNCTYGVR